MARKKRTRDRQAKRKKPTKPSDAKGTGRGPARFSEEDRKKALELMLRGMRRAEIARRIGCSTESLRLWARAAERPPQPNEQRHGGREPRGRDARVEKKGKAEARSTVPHDPPAGLSQPEVQAILEYRRRHPTMGPAQIRAQLKRFKGWRISLRAIARVLRVNGYDLQHRQGRPEEPEPPRRWEAPYRNALWQIDATEVRIPEGRRALVVMIDDFSRYIVGCELFETLVSENIVAMLKEAIRLHGKPAAIYTDRAGPFLAWGRPESLQRFLEAELIDHYTTRAYRPQGRGKVEAAIATLKRELWEVQHFASEEEARAELRLFVDRYNHRRAHLGLEGLTPADRFHGRWEKVLALVQAESRNRQGVADLRETGGISTELLPEGWAEIIRLVVVDGALELRFFGHRVRLGRIES